MMPEIKLPDVTQDVFRVVRDHTEAGDSAYMAHFDFRLHPACTYAKKRATAAAI